MRATSVPPALEARLGQEATLELRRLLDVEERDWSDRVTAMTIERVEHRLAEELGALRLEMAAGLAGVRRELAENRVDLLKWSFVFWVGQVVAMVGILTVLLRGVR